MEIGDLIGDVGGAVRLKRMQNGRVVHDPKRAGGGVAVVATKLNGVDLGGGAQTGVDDAQGLGGAAHIAVFEFVAISALVVESVTDADIGADGAEDFSVNVST